MLRIDTDKGEVVVEDGDDEQIYPMDSAEAFSAISQAWLRCGWDVKYVYSFSWLGRPIIQLPDDMVRIQEVIYTIQPDVIIETGVAHGGSLTYYAGLCKILDKGRVIGIDIDIRQHNRKAIEEHFLFPWITLVEGPSTDARIAAQVRAMVRPGESVLLLLDSNHSKEHVSAELETYSSLITPGSYIVSMDGIMRDVAGAPRTKPDWEWNNPLQANREFVAEHPEFEIVEPEFLFNESSVSKRVTYWPECFLRRTENPQSA
jgi:cephalosporin hydroxylase|tara:strand:+ start:4612 stop:5391 length:780 start_codon:yes stop_codon:yes gene_type:complete